MRGGKRKEKKLLLSSYLFLSPSFSCCNFSKVCLFLQVVFGVAARGHREEEGGGGGAGG